MKVGVGDGVAVAVGLGGTVGVAEGAGVVGVWVALITGAGCDVQALRRTRDRATERKRDFMCAIIVEAARHVKPAPLVDMPLPVCYTDERLLFIRHAPRSVLLSGIQIRRWKDFWIPAYNMRE